MTFVFFIGIGKTDQAPNCLYTIINIQSEIPLNIILNPKHKLAAYVLK